MNLIQPVGKAGKTPLPSQHLQTDRQGEKALQAEACKTLKRAYFREQHLMSRQHQELLEEQLGDVDRTIRGGQVEEARSHLFAVMANLKWLNPAS